jgi:hypothetical protein
LLIVAGMAEVNEYGLLCSPGEIKSKHRMTRKNQGERRARCEDSARC